MLSLSALERALFEHKYLPDLSTKSELWGVARLWEPSRRLHPGGLTRTFNWAKRDFWVVR